MADPGAVEAELLAELNGLKDAFVTGGGVAGVEETNGPMARNPMRSNGDPAAGTSEV
jgi:hypothetical protein